jgi:hypothetical protein
MALSGRFLFDFKDDNTTRVYNMSLIQQKAPVGADTKWLELVVQNVKSLRYGVVEIVVHDSRVIQIEKTERVRLDKTDNRADPT